MSHGTSIAELQKLCHDMARTKGWWDKEPNIGEKLALMHSELSEALEHYRDGNFGTGLDTIVMNGDKPDGFVVELADVVIRIMDLCGYLGAPLERAVIDKMAYNANRPYRHGGKKA